MRICSSEDDDNYRRHSAQERAPVLINQCLIVYQRMEDIPRARLDSLSRALRCGVGSLREDCCCGIEGEKQSEQHLVCVCAQVKPAGG